MIDCSFQGMKDINQISNLPGKSKLFKYSLDLSNNIIQEIDPDLISVFKFVDLIKNPACDNAGINSMKNVRCDVQSSEEEEQEE